MQYKTRFVFTILSVSLALLLAIAPRVQAIDAVSDSMFDATFNHSHIEREEVVDVAKSYPSLDVKIHRVAFTDALILIEVLAKNTGDRIIDFAPEQGYVSVGDFRVSANPFATQSTEEYRSSLILPGRDRHITLVYAGDFGQQNWNPWAVSAMTVHLFREGDSGVILSF